MYKLGKGFTMPMQAGNMRYNAGLKWHKGNGNYHSTANNARGNWYANTPPKKNTHTLICPPLSPQPPELLHSLINVLSLRPCWMLRVCGSRYGISCHGSFWRGLGSGSRCTYKKDFARVRTPCLLPAVLSTRG